MKENITFKEYSDYLETISFKAKLYRKYFYFPKLNKYLVNKILEVGCGIGGFLEYNSNVHGIDINPDLINICKKKKLNASLMELDKIPFDDNKYNSVLLDNVLEHIQNPKKLILEIKRVLKNDGILLISVPGKKGFKHDKDHINFYDEKKLNETMFKFGFVTKVCFYTPFKSNFLNNYLRQYCLHGVFVKMNK